MIYSFWNLIDQTFYFQLIKYSTEKSLLNWDICNERDILWFWDTYIPSEFRFNRITVINLFTIYTRRRNVLFQDYRICGRVKAVNEHVLLNCGTNIIILARDIRGAEITLTALAEITGRIWSHRTRGYLIRSVAASAVRGYANSLPLVRRRNTIRPL